MAKELDKLEERSKNNQLMKLIERYGEVRSVHKVETGFYISDLYINGYGELRLDCTDLISTTRLIEELLTNKDITRDKHLLFQSRDEVMNNKCQALETIESYITKYIYESCDNEFMEHRDYILDNVDFSRLPKKDYYKGAIEFIESDNALKSGDHHFLRLCHNDKVDKLQEFLDSYSCIVHLTKNSYNDILMRHIFLDADGNISLEVFCPLTGVIFETIFERQIYAEKGKHINYLEAMCSFTHSEIKKFKLDAADELMEVLSSSVYSKHTSELANEVKYFFSKTNIDELDILNLKDGILDFMESSIKETFFIKRY